MKSATSGSITCFIDEHEQAFLCRLHAGGEHFMNSVVDADTIELHLVNEHHISAEAADFEVSRARDFARFKLAEKE